MPVTEGSTATGAPTASADGKARLLTKYGKFVVVGITGVVVNLIVFALTLDALSPSPTFNLYASFLHSVSVVSPNALDNFVASAVAFVVATLWNFAWNNVWTFRSRVGHRHPIGVRVGLYYGVSLGSLAVNEIVLFVLSLAFPPLYGQALGIALGSVVGFAGNHRFTFAEADLGG